MTTCPNVPFFATKDGRTIGHSFAVNAAIRALTGKRARILGRPSRNAMRCALRQVGLPAHAAWQVVVVGDDLALEMCLARNSGSMGIAVTTGLQDGAAFARAPKTEKPWGSGLLLIHCCSVTVDCEIAQWRSKYCNQA